MKLALHLLVSLLVMLFVVDPASAHRFAPSLLEAEEITPQTYRIVWKTPAQATSATPLQPVFPDACELDGESLTVQEGTGLVSTLTLNCEALGSTGLVGQSIGVSGLAENQTTAMVMLSLQDGRHYQSTLTVEEPDYLVPHSPSIGAVLVDYSWLGMEHIWGGLDHLLFVTGLLLLVGGGMRLLWTITAFTVGHSITLIAVTLGAIEYPVSLIEFIIALSIFVVALELSRTIGQNADEREDGTRGLIRRHPWWLAGGFGLLHGMGFAGALTEIGLPQDNIPLALLSFNVGIEVGQVIFVAALLAAWRVIGRITNVNVDRFAPLPIYVLGALSAMWCVERSIEVLS